MFEEFKVKPKLESEDLKKFHFTFNDIIWAYEIGVIDIEIIKIFISNMLSKNQDESQEEIFIRLLWAKNENDFLDYLRELSSNEGTYDSSGRFRKVLSWLNVRHYLEDLSDFELNEFLTDLVADLGFPKIEKELFYVSFDQSRILKGRIKDYLK